MKIKTIKENILIMAIVLFPLLSIYSFDNNTITNVGLLFFIFALFINTKYHKPKKIMLD